MWLAVFQKAVTYFFVIRLKQVMGQLDILDFNSKVNQLVPVSSSKNRD